MNPQKAKGDAAEREAVALLRDLTPDLVRPKAQRLLGAGRKEDVGDLYVYDDTAIQVRNYGTATIGTAIRSSAADAVLQAANGDKDHAVGMVPIPRAPKNGAVRWLACVEEGRWPTVVEPAAEFHMVGRLLTWVRDDNGPHGYTAWPRIQRIALLHGGHRPVLVAPIEAWVAAYRDTRAAPISTTTPSRRLESTTITDTPTAPTAQSA